MAGGISSFFCKRGLASLYPRTNEKLLNKNVPFGNEPQRLLETVPRLQLHVEQVPTDQEAPLRNNQVAMVFRVTVSKKSWSEKNEDISNSSHTIFLLIGSHAKPVDFFQRFTLQGREERVVTATIHVSRKRSSRWIDFLTGSDDFVGCDFHHRVHVPGTATGNDLAAETGSENIGLESLHHDECLVSADSKHNSRGEKKLIGPENSSSDQNRRTSTACKHTCKDKSRCKHICCFIQASKSQSTSRQTALKETTSAIARDYVEKRPAGNDTLQNLEKMREKARPLTSSLPVKRLRENSEPAPSFLGTRLEAFFQQESNPHEELLSWRNDLKQSTNHCQDSRQELPAKAIPREDSYDAIFSLLVEEQETSGNVSKSFCLEKHLEETEDPGFLDLTLPDMDSIFPFP